MSSPAERYAEAYSERRATLKADIKEQLKAITVNIPVTVFIINGEEVDLGAEELKAMLSSISASEIINVALVKNVVQLSHD